jgi:hypothetical protein
MHLSVAACPEGRRGDLLDLVAAGLFYNSDRLAAHRLSPCVAKIRNSHHAEARPVAAVRSGGIEFCRMGLRNENRVTRDGTPPATSWDRAPQRGVGARGRSRSPAGLAGYVRRPRRAA